MRVVTEDAIAVNSAAKALRRVSADLAWASLKPNPDHPSTSGCRRARRIDSLSHLVLSRVQPSYCGTGGLENWHRECKVTRKATTSTGEEAESIEGSDDELNHSVR